MAAQSGIGTTTRMDILKFSANIMIDVLHENNGLGIVAFDHDPYDVLDFTGPVGPPPTPSNPFEAGRSAMHQAIDNFAFNTNGFTAIGDGIERAILRLNPVSTYDSKSIIVFTDGQETDPKYISDIADQITDRMFAIGLGKANAINPATLNEITNANEGYMLLADNLGEDSVFKLAKYFLQIQAGVNNEDVVVDPDGTLYGDQVHKIPFLVNDADIRVDVITMIPHPSLVDFYLETPSGQIVKPADAYTTPGLTYGIGNNVAYYRMSLPLPIGTPEKEGKWNAVLTINRKYNSKHGFDKYANRSYSAATADQGKVPYSLLVHSYSNLKMKTQVVQEHYEPGALLTINVSLTQFGIPLNKPCKVTAYITLPDHSTETLILTNAGTGKYSGKRIADQPGYYQIRVKADGHSLRGKPFTREQIRSASCYRGGNQPSPSGGNDPGTDEKWCKLLKCLLSEKNISQEFKKRLKEQGINIDGMLECIQSLCTKKRGKAATVIANEKLRSQYASLIQVYDELMKEDQG
ncbi:VWA domain-containing protein [Dyadobacter sp. CY323]|nr:VWA domain-containing protein [Dyadobacter sp. CY323]